MNRNQIWQSIELELRKAKRQHPNWPDHIAAQAGIVNNRSGKLMDLALQMKYNKDKSKKTKDHFRNRIEAEAIKVAVTAIRFLENLKS